MTAIPASPRQLNAWIKRGLLNPEPGPQGSGYAWRWSDKELAVAVVMARLVNAGVKAEAACVVARAGGVGEIADGITVAVDRPGCAHELHGGGRHG